MRRSRTSLWMIVGSFLWIAACGGGDELCVESAYAVATPGGSTGAVYLTLRNPTDEDDVLLRVSTPAAKAAEVHETIDDGGVLRMEAFPEGLPVPASRHVELRPGGKHVMLLALNRELVPGETLELTLELENAGSRTLSVPIRDPEP